jgi:hypothetical protein
VTPSPNQSTVQAALVNFLTAVLPATGSDGKPVSVLTAQQNRVPEPLGTDFCLVTPIRFERLETNYDTTADVRFTGSIVGGIMAVSAVSIGPIAVGAQVFGSGVAANTFVTAVGSAGGTYNIAPAQNVPAQLMAAGQLVIQQAVKVTVQLDFHSQNATTAGDMAQTVSTLFRDEYAVDQFANQPPPNNGVVPLYAEDPAQRPFINESQQYEWRWTIDVYVQINQIVTVPQQYADAITVVLKDVDEVFPPPPPPPPQNGYITEDVFVYYVSEDGSVYYIQETA